MAPIDFYKHLNERRESRVILMFYSPTYDKYSMVSALAVQKNLCTRLNLFVTDNKERLREHHAFPASFLKDDLFLDYPTDGMPLGLKNALENSVHIFFDDAKKFIDTMINYDGHDVNVKEEYDLNKTKARIFVLVDRSYEGDVVEKIYQHYPRAITVDVQLISQELKDVHILHRSIGGGPQQVGYRAKLDWENAVIRRVNETKKPDARDYERMNRAENNRYAQQYLNVVYPDDIQRAYDYVSREISFTIPEDVDYSKNGWMTRILLGQLSDNSPKLVDMLGVIRLHDNVKHLVFSDYVDHHGLQYIKTLLGYMGISSQILTIEDGDAEIRDVTVYLTNDRNFEHYQFANIYHIHLFDSISPQDCYSNIFHIISRRNYELVTGRVSVHYYVLDFPNMITADRRNYDKMVTRRDKTVGYHASHLKNAIKIRAYEDVGLVYDE